MTQIKANNTPDAVDSKKHLLMPPCIHIIVQVVPFSQKGIFVESNLKNKEGTEN